MIGLRKGTVQVVAYQATWPDLFEQERRVLPQHLGHLALDIQHVGSTAVPDLEAKPIIDIAVAVTFVTLIPQCRQPLCALGYIDRGDKGKEGGYLFVKESTPDVRTHHLHMVAKDDPQWDNYLRLQDLLRADKGLRGENVVLKRALQREFAQDRKSYTKAKQDFIRALLQQALKV
jgi:GrpB-like predicted nucleotidyltransferase (UPF0157 family)